MRRWCGRQCAIETAPELLVPGALSKGRKTAQIAVEANTIAEHISGKDCCLARRLPATMGAAIPALF
jgi:hypothetical protein